jgi:hypothetical protein
MNNKTRSSARHATDSARCQRCKNANVIAAHVDGCYASTRFLNHRFIHFMLNSTSAHLTVATDPPGNL